ncbi:MAG: DUF5074 domain-containing protein [Muribaculaceae bacterium]
MKRNLLATIVLIALGTITAAAATVDYTKGVFMLTEGWGGHEHGYLNFRQDDGTMVYRVVETANGDNTKQLGITAEFATVYADHIYITSKQACMSGETFGCRVAKLNATTLQLEAQLVDLPNGGDGRGIAATDNAVFVGTSKGILVYDTDLTECKATINGSVEYGNMKYVHGALYAVQRLGNVDVIDAESYEIIKSFEGEYSDIVMSHDGNLWVSIRGEKALLKIDAYSFDSEKVEVEAGVALNEWASCPDGFLASCKENKLYWRTVDGWENFGIYCYDIDANQLTKIIDMSADGYVFYNGGVGIDPETDNICSMMNERSYGPKSAYREWSSTGELVIDEEMLQSVEVNGESILTKYPFPALVFFPDRYAPEIDDSALGTVAEGATASYLITDIVSDADNQDAAIDLFIDATGCISATISRNELMITGLAQGEGSLTITANSNGKIATKTIDYSTTGIADVVAADVTVTAGAGIIRVNTPAESQLQVYDVQGRIVASSPVEAGLSNVGVQHLTAGVYVVKVAGTSHKIVLE